MIIFTWTLLLLLCYYYYHFYYFSGLKATEFFLSEYITYILQIDFNSVAVLWNEKYGIKLSRTFTCLSEDIDEIIKYLEELSLTEVRCLLWLLEENRQCFPFLHQCLDDYFNNLGKCARMHKRHSMKSLSPVWKKSPKITWQKGIADFSGNVSLAR